MKRNNLYLILLFFCFSCKSQNNDYQVIHTRQNEILATYYFHGNDIEYARIYGNEIKSDSLAFFKDKNDLIMKEFSGSQTQKLPIGNIRYVDYYTDITDIVVTGNPFSIDEVPVVNFNFIKKDQELEKFANENCHHKKGEYVNCDFTLPKSYELPFIPISSTINTFKIKKSGNNLEEIQMNLLYNDKKIIYTRKYYYQNKKIDKIITIVNDNVSTITYQDKFEIVKT